MKGKDERSSDIKSFLDSLTSDDIYQINMQQYQKAAIEYNEFVCQFSKGVCYLCSKPIKTFNKNNPCLHWLLKPKGFKKKHIEDIAKRYSAHQIEAYLRWVANQDMKTCNINEIPEEGSNSKLLEITIKYKNLEWSISCGKSDFAGHQKSAYGNFPHYHFQMRLDGRAFIRYKDFHLPLHEQDIFGIKAIQSGSKIKRTCLFGEGVNDLLNAIVDSNGEIMEHMNSSDTEEKASLHFSTMVMADDGQTLNGDEIFDAITRAKEKNAPISSEIYKISNANTRTFISATDNVVEQAPRKQRKSQNKDNDENKE